MQLLGSLSGGNRQKFLLARELFLEPKVVMANNPTKGLDIGAAQDIRGVLMKERDKGKALIVISTDLDEILQIADRIAVMNAGRIEKVMDAKKCESPGIGALHDDDKFREYFLLHHRHATPYQPLKK